MIQTIFFKFLLGRCGKDCFKTYEILLLGAIVIVPSGDSEWRRWPAAQTTFEGLPVVVVTIGLR